MLVDSSFHSYMLDKTTFFKLKLVFTKLKLVKPSFDQQNPLKIVLTLCQN